MDCSVYRRPMRQAALIVAVTATLALVACSDESTQPSHLTPR